MSITKVDNFKINHLIAILEAMEGTNIPFPTARKMSEIYYELKEFVEMESVVD